MRARAALSREQIAKGRRPAVVARVLQVNRSGLYRTPKRRPATTRRAVLDPVDRLIVDVAHANPSDGTRMVAALASQQLGRAGQPQAGAAGDAPAAALAAPPAAAASASSRLLPGRVSRSAPRPSPAAASRRSSSSSVSRTGGAATATPRARRSSKAGSASSSNASSGAPSSRPSTTHSPQSPNTSTATTTGRTAACATARRLDVRRRGRVGGIPGALERSGFSWRRARSCRQGAR